MIAAVADFSFEYFSTIELMAFSYAISGCSFSTSEIQIERNPRHRFPSRLKNPTSATSAPFENREPITTYYGTRTAGFPPGARSGSGSRRRRIVEPRRRLDHPGHRLLP